MPPPATDIATARANNIAFDACYEGGNNCDIAGTYAASSVKYEATAGASPVTLPVSPTTWLAWNHSTQTFTIAPATANPDLIGTYKVYATYSAPAGSGTPTEFHVLTVTIDCVVTSFTRPSDYTGTYNL